MLTETALFFRTLLQKHIEQVTINVFHEYSMTNARPISEFTGFTEQEILDLCDEYRMSSEAFKQWYDGYDMDGISIYNPKSVVEACLRGMFNSYWTQTETYHALSDYIRMNFDGLREKIILMLAGDYTWSSYEHL